jgi:hypothetical protein
MEKTDDDKSWDISEILERRFGFKWK